MTKYDFVIHHSEYDSFLEKVRSLGVLHVATLSQESDTYEQLRDKYAQQLLIDKHIAICQNLVDTVSGECKRNKTKMPVLAKCQHLDIKQGLAFVEESERLHVEFEKNKQELAAAERELQRMQVWGDYSAEKTDKLRNSGLVVSFYSCQSRVWRDEWQDEYNAFVINSTGNTIYFVTVTKDIAEGIDAEPFAMSEYSIGQLQESVKECEKRCFEHEELIRQFAFANLNNLKYLSAQIHDEINMDRVHLNTERAADDTIMILEGYCPDNLKQTLDAMLESDGIYYQTSEPVAEDNVPIKLRNNWFTRMFEPLTGMYGMPVYQEFDPTPVLAPFFLLFFALCMGDAGYGLLLILFGLGLKSGKIRMEMFDGLGPIITTLGIGTAIIGFFLGTAFGIDLYTASWIPETLKCVMIKGKVAGFDIQMVMAIAIGIFHICLAMAIKAIGYTKRWGLAQSLSTWGWLLLIVGGLTTILLAVGNLVSAEAAKYTLIAIGAISALGIYIFNDPKRNVFINIGSGLWDTYNMATGLLGDTLSYIRLYALGLAGGMLGGAFNNLGGMILGDDPSVASWIPYVLVLAFGHLLNLAMSALGAFVHPLRLTFVEYFKNAGYEGKGEVYSPLTKTAK